MKKIYFAIGALSALLLSGCTQQELDTPVGRTNVLTAVMEGEDQTKSDATDEGVFTWAKGDKIFVQTSTGGREGTLAGDGGSSSGNFQYTLIGDETETGFAVYPYNSGHRITAEGINVVLPETYQLGETLRNTNAIMLACPEEAATADDQTKESSYKFNHLAGVMRFNFKNVPAGVNRFELSLGGAKINGTFSVTDDQIATVATENEAETTTALTFTALDENTDITLFVPVPVGTYTGATLAFYEGESKVWSYESQAENTVARRNLVKMPTVTVASSSGEIINYVNTPQALKDAILAGGTIVLTEDITLDEILTINKPVTLDGNGKTLTSSAGRAINVDTEGSVTIQNLTINAAERAINIINEPATVNVNKVTATANNNAIMIATSAGAAKLTVEESDLTGLAVINVAGAGAQVEIKNTKITNVDPVGTDAAYGAITVSGTAENSKVSVSGGSIVVADNSKTAYVFPGTATVTGVDNVGYVYAAIGDNGCESLAKAIEEAKAGQTITILRDITLENYLEINKSITLDLGENDINTAVVDGKHKTALYVNSDIEVTIKGSTGKVTGNQGLFVKKGLVRIYGGHFHGTNDNGEAVYVINGGKVEIYGGTFSGESTKNLFVLNEYDATRDVTDIKVYGGKFLAFDPANNAAEGEGTNFVAPGYSSVANGEYYEVKEGVYNETALKAAIAAGGNVTLDSDIILTSPIIVESTVVLNLNNKNITTTSEGEEIDAFQVKNNGSLTINGDGTVKATMDCVWAMDNAYVEINGGNFEAGCEAVYAKNNANAVINNGSFKVEGEWGQTYTLNLKDDSRETASITVKGGTYYNFDPANNTAEGEGTNFVADGYVSNSADNGDTYVVTASNEN